jgi:16S rRNA processing protein RimM
MSSDPPDFVEVGRVGRPHGLDGAFVVERGSDDEQRFAVGAKLHVDGAIAEVVLRRRVGGRRVAIKLDRPVQRGQMLTVLRSELPAPEEGAYYIFQLVGLEVEEAGRVIGRVREVLPGAANDNLELDTGTLIPLVEAAVAKVDLEQGRIHLNPGFTD